VPPLASLGPALLQQDDQQLKAYHEWQQAVADADRAFDAEVGDEALGTPPTQGTPQLIPVCRAPAPGQPCADLYWVPQIGKFELPPLEHLLSIPRFIQQPFEPQDQKNTNDCGPFSTAIALNAYLNTDRYKGADIAQEMNHSIWYRWPNYATWPWGVAAYIRRQGVPARMRPFASELDLQEAIDQNRIVIVMIGWHDGFKLQGHYMVLAGYDPQQGYRFVDPASGTFEFRRRDEFLQGWAFWGRVIIEVGK